MADGRHNAARETKLKDVSPAHSPIPGQRQPMEGELTASLKDD
jgi:hypothetical protein